MTMPETLKPDELVRDIFEVANQLGGYIGPSTPDDLAEFLKRESDEAAKLAYRIVALQSDLERVTAERDALKHDVESAGALRLRMEAHRQSAADARANFLTMQGTAAKLLEDANAYKAAMTANLSRALTAEAALVKARKALEPFAKAADDAEKHAGWDGPRGDFISYEVLRAARLALSAGEEEK